MTTKNKDKCEKGHALVPGNIYIVPNGGYIACKKCRKEYAKNYARERTVEIIEKPTKICYKCKIEKNSNDFHKNNSLKDGRCTYCKECTKPDSFRKNLLKYGITTEEYEVMLLEQGNVCAICLKPESRRTGKETIDKLSVDHCHETGVVRGLLCHKCNSGIGFLGDNAENLPRLINYFDNIKIQKMLGVGVESNGQPTQDRCTDDHW